MNLAILVGVSKYAKPVSDLPAGTNDARLMKKLLESTNKYNDHLLDLSDDTNSAAVKTRLAEFISKHKGQKIDELFFYYSGHGDLYKDDFYYLLSDFTDDKRNQTSLPTQELDAMLRSLSPTLTIKVVDACHAGVTYIKEPNALAKHLDESKGRFENCYFMFSSQSSQSSFQDDKLSDFTESFLEACVKFSGKEIRYKDIIDHIADTFASNADQTPKFVVQADYTEKFCIVDGEIKKLLVGEQEEKKKADQKPQETARSASSILNHVKEQAQEFCTKEEAQKFLLGVKNHLEKCQFVGDLAEMYQLTAEFCDSYDNIPDRTSVGVWLKENQGGFFAKVLYKDERYQEVDTDPFTRIIGGISTGPKLVTKIRSVPSGLELTAETPYKAIRISAKPAFENLPHGIFAAVFVLSKRDCVFFYKSQMLRESDWGKLAEGDQQKWFYGVYKMKSDLTGTSTAVDLLRKFETSLTKSIKEKLGLPSDEAGKKVPAEKQQNK